MSESAGEFWSASSACCSEAFDVDLRTSCGFTDGCLWHWVLHLLPSYTGWSLLFLALASLIYLPKEPAGAAVRAPSALDVPADWLDTFQQLVNSAYHSVFTFLVRVERIYSDSWLSSSLAAKLLRGVTRPSADVYSSNHAHMRLPFCVIDKKLTFATPRVLILK